jgi:AmmeMemoRadiSam system protein B
MLRVRPAAVAGSFYPAKSEALAAEVDRLLSRAHPVREARRTLRALIVPHAGYVYSGAVAATGYAWLRLLAPRIRRVALLGPAHFAPVAGVALPDAEAFESPLGRVRLDLEDMKRLQSLPQVGIHSAAHAREHALEVQLPFLQRILGEFTLVPLVAGRASPDEVAGVIRALDADGTFVLVSSDLSHYLQYDEARAADRATADRIVALEPVSWDDACGATPVNGLLAWARALGLTASLLDLRNSGDTAGARDRVVGYGAFAFEEERPAGG